MNKFLAISVYQKRGDRISLVFRKKNVLYRITTIVQAKHFVKQLSQYAAELNAKCANPEYVQQVYCPRNRNRVLEIGLNQDAAVLMVFEAVNGSMKAVFVWNGHLNDLSGALKNL